MLKIDASFLEGGGQILRTALSLSIITAKPIEIYNIRKKRPQPGLKPQHLSILRTYKELLGAKVEGDYLGSEHIQFFPASTLLSRKYFLDIGTAGSIGLILQSLVLTFNFIVKEDIELRLKGGTAGKWAIPVDYYPQVVFKTLNIDAQLRIIRRGYYPKGGGEVILRFKPQRSLRKIILDKFSPPQKIIISSIASSSLRSRNVAHRQLESARKALVASLKEIPLEERVEYVDTLSPGSEVNICCPLESGSILWADSLGEKTKPAEEVGREAALKLLSEIENQACVDLHFADNVVPYLYLLGGRVKTSQISMHTRTNVWVGKIFFGDILKVDEFEKVLEVEKGVWK